MLLQDKLKLLEEENFELVQKEIESNNYKQQSEVDLRQKESQITQLRGNLKAANESINRLKVRVGMDSSMTP